MRVPCNLKRRLDPAGGAVVIGCRRILGQKFATDALVIAFGVVVGDVFVNKMSQVRFAKDNELIEALMPDGLDEALTIRITVRALRRNGDAADAGAG